MGQPKNEKEEDKNKEVKSFEINVDSDEKANILSAFLNSIDYVEIRDDDQLPDLPTDKPKS